MPWLDLRSGDCEVWGTAVAEYSLVLSMADAAYSAVAEYRAGLACGYAACVYYYAAAEAAVAEASGEFACYTDVEFAYVATVLEM